MTKGTIKVFTIDDHEMVRAGISSFLNLQLGLDVIGEANSLEAALPSIELTPPDVVLMDLIIEDKLVGVDATQALKACYPEIQVVILTSYHEDKMIFPALDAGAVSYLLKDITPNDLADAVFRANKGITTLSPIVATKILKAQKQQQVLLSDREIEILIKVANGFSNAEIAEILFISVKTVRTHVSNILGKLNLRDRTQAAVHAWKSGLVE
ncbi:DNA-binding response regulator [Parashewanella spongiae]|uniref:DNA-binding response regulator n=1 Tax=Parashewanella spongiae TaxID=342950 RepID=A0A3A6TNK3_9GAMM|nr:response regulator transcription factor [Parashewanella spongiae]MCL1079936.1 response regulator transcription factor [Parashewanella spongiae]RJY06203.1 DNA-binding response regulator [Parashewanella spongiae]